MTTEAGAADGGDYSLRASRCAQEFAVRGPDGDGDKYTPPRPGRPGHLRYGTMLAHTRLHRHSDIRPAALVVPTSRSLTAQIQQLITATQSSPSMRPSRNR